MDIKYYNHASFPMYYWQGQQEYWQIFWQELKRETNIDDNIPLIKDDELDDIWHSKHLLISQTCGRPYLYNLQGKTRLLGAFSYNIDEKNAKKIRATPYYFSYILKKKGGHVSPYSHQARWAVNAMQSQSGYSGMMYFLRAENVKASPDIYLTGSHYQSLQYLLQEKADFCAIDCICFALAQKYCEDMDNIEIVTTTPLVPSLPLITHLNMPNEIVQRLQMGLKKICNRPDLKSLLSDLFIDDFHVIDDDIFNEIAKKDAHFGITFSRE